ncbi:hypothetical protein ACH5RR_013423 [Cinchona calisaya]|uniref:Uncharacterized protein n=1 Tax=Cinchona calisaya TaxID=153742 RepID=A0ABD3A007_9GENT
MADVSENCNGFYVEVVGENQDEKNSKRSCQERRADEEEIITLCTIFNRLIAAIFFPNSDAPSAPPLLHRIKAALSQNIPLLRVATKNSAHHLLLWTRRGSPLRPLIVVSVGTIALLALTGFLVFMLFFVAATINAIVISLLVSLAAVGGFLAIFFAFLTAIYIGALLVAVFVITATTVSAIVAALIVTGWIGLFWTIWLVTQKGVGLVKQSLSMTGSVVSSYSSAGFARSHHASNKYGRNEKICCSFG